MVGEKRLQVLGMGNLGDSDLSVGLVHYLLHAIGVLRPVVTAEQGHFSFDDRMVPV